MLEAITTVCGDAVVAYDATGRLPRLHGNYHPGIAPHNNYAARIGECLTLATQTEAAWLKLIIYLGDDRLAAWHGARRTKPISMLS